MLLQDFFGTHSRHWLGWILLIACLCLFLLCAVLALLFAFLHCLTCACWKTIKESGIPGASSEAGLHYCTCENVFLVEVALDGCSDFSVATAGIPGVLWSSLPLEAALSQPLHEVKHSFIQPAVLKQPSMNIQPLNNLFQCSSSTSFRREDLVSITQLISRTRRLLRPTRRTSKKNLRNFRISQSKVLC